MNATSSTFNPEVFTNSLTRTEFHTLQKALNPTHSDLMTIRLPTKIKLYEW